MYGWWEAVASIQGVREATGQRGFMVSRSTFVGGGKYTSHWLGAYVKALKRTHEDHFSPAKVFPRELHSHSLSHLIS